MVEFIFLFSSPPDCVSGSNPDASNVSLQTTRRKGRLVHEYFLENQDAGVFHVELLGSEL